MTNDKRNEADVASWRRLLNKAGPHLDPDERLRLHQILEDLKSNPPESGQEAAPPASIQFPGPPTAAAPLGRLGDYDVLEELGAGAFGTVFRGLDRRLGREVAIKVLNPDHATIYRDRQRFQDEARVVSSLQHDHIVRIYDVGDASDFPLPYLVMELVHGQSLEEFLAARESVGERMVEPRMAARLARQIALALSAAHEQGLVHRDIKPSNIVLERQAGRAKVTDFGLARQVMAPGRSEGTRSGRIIGTFGYMSPEQVVDPRQVDGRSDLYSLGVVLYELLTGERPFRGTTSALLVQVVHDEPQPPRRLNPGVPRDLETICLKCLEKEPGRRFDTAAALSDELERFLSGEPIRARPVPFWERLAKWARRKPAVATLLAAVVLIATLGFAGVTWQWGRAERRRAEAIDAQRASEVARDAERSLREQVERNLYFQRVARAHLEWLNNNLARADQLLEECPEPFRGWEWRYLRRLFHPEYRTLREHELPVRPIAFSADGRMIATSGALWNSRRRGRVIVWNAKTGDQLHSFTDRVGGFHGLAFSPDGKRLAGANPNMGITIWNLATGRAEMRLTRSGHYDVQFSPSGDLLAGASSSGDVHLWDALSGGLLHTMSGHTALVYTVTFSPDGALLASTGNDNTGRIWDTKTGQLVRLLAGTGERGIAFSPDGRYFAAGGYAGRRSGIVKLWDTRKEWNEVFVQRVYAGPVSQIAFSPDGRCLAMNNPHSGVVHLWDMPSGRERPAIRAHPTTLGVAFSPDGRTLATCGGDRVAKLWDLTRQRSAFGGQGGAYVTDLAFWPGRRSLAVADGYNLAAPGRGARTTQIWDTADSSRLKLQRVLDGHNDWLTSIAFSGDGQRFASADRAGAIRIWETSGKKGAFNIGAHRGPVTCVAFSHDGKYVVSSGAKGNVTLWDAQTGTSLRSLEKQEGMVHCVAIRPDGRTIATAGEDHTAKLWDLATGRELRALEGHDAAVRGLAFSSDGRLLATCGDDGLVLVWQLPEEADASAEQQALDQPLHALRGHTAPTVAVAFNHDDTRLASISEDATVKVWDVDAGQDAITLIPEESGPAYSVRFSPDGNLLAAARGSRVTLWDARPAAGYSTERLAPHAGEDHKSICDWHEDQIVACKRAGNWFGRIFHLSQLIALNPDEPTYLFRRANTYALWSQTDEGERRHVEKSLADVHHAVLLGGNLLAPVKSDD